MNLYREALESLREGETSEGLRQFILAVEDDFRKLEKRIDHLDHQNRELNKRIDFFKSEIEEAKGKPRRGWQPFADTGAPFGCQVTLFLGTLAMMLFAIYSITRFIKLVWAMD